MYIFYLQFNLQVPFPSYEPQYVSLECTAIYTNETLGNTINPHQQGF